LPAFELCTGFWARLLTLSTAWRGGWYGRISQSSDLGGSSSRPSREGGFDYGNIFSATVRRTLGEGVFSGYFPLARATTGDQFY